MKVKINMKEIFFIIGLFAILITIYLLDNNMSIIKDKDFLKCITYSLKKYSYTNNKINKENLGQISTLRINNKKYNIKDVDGIKYLKKLYILSYYNVDKMANIKQVSELNKLKRISLFMGEAKYFLNNVKSNSVTTLWLESLNMQGVDEISDNYPNLRNLHCDNLQLKDLSLLKNTKASCSWYIYKCDIQSIEGVEYLSNLKLLSIENCKMSQSDKNKLDTLENVELNEIKIIE